MSGGKDKNDRDNSEYQTGYDAGRNGAGGVYAAATFVLGETSSEKAGREDGERDRADHGSQK